MTTLTRTTPVLFTILMVVAAIAAMTESSVAARKGPLSGDVAYVQPKHDPVVSPWAASVIEQRTESGVTNVWVYFTDKGFSDGSGMAAKASAQNVYLTPRAAARRAKIDRDRVGFIDMPVHEAYVEQVAAAGARLRHVSRWLNAASFEVSTYRLNAIAELPFVRKIDPVIGFRAEPGDLGSADKSLVDLRADDAEPSDPLDYGSSLGQLQQVNVPAAHDLGHRGQGVLVCLMDTGYRKDHVAFQQAYLDGRVLAERDFVFNDSNTQDEPGIDQPGQHNHGTYIWSALGGEYDGELYGPAFEAEFILAKTEDIRSETQVEEDNWLAGVEWADSIGAQVISSSLVYKDWYVYANYNGDFCVSTDAADLAASLGILVCNAMGNYGNGPTLGAPADADSILGCGAVSSTGLIAGFSSGGPTADGRIKPEVCAQGISTRCANPGGTTGFTTASGTSLSTPLVGGCAAVVMSAHPDWTAMMVREALMNTASQPSTPDNIYGWGIVDVLAAINYQGFTHIPGDLNYDRAIDVLDITLEIDIVFVGAAFPDPPVTPDINLDGIVNAQDLVYLIDHVFRGGAPPPAPSQ